MSVYWSNLCIRVRCLYNIRLSVSSLNVAKLVDCDYGVRAVRVHNVRIVVAYLYALSNVHILLGCLYSSGVSEYYVSACILFTFQMPVYLDVSIVYVLVGCLSCCRLLYV